MAVFTLRTADGEVRRSVVQAGLTVQQALAFEPGALRAPCGGHGRCGKCRVKVSGALSPMDDAERRMLGSNAAASYRLACQARVAGDCTVWLPPRQALQASAAGEVSGEPGECLFTKYGVAIDIGTTTLAAHLYCPDGKLAECSAPNPQAAFGTDIMTRIEKSRSGQRAALSQCIRRGLNTLVENLAEDAAVFVTDIDAAVITGNTTMLYLLTGRDPDCLSRAPFIPDERFGQEYSGAELGLFPAADVRVYIPPCISAFVGADITCAVFSSGICGARDTALMVDIGTNGEMVLWHNGALLCASAAAGPVFEGASLSCGMQGFPGAVDHVRYGGGYRCSTIGGLPACGICGSGVVDAAAALLDAGALSASGRLSQRGPVFLTDTVFITQNDIRMIQAAKAAVCSGIRTLLQSAGLQESDVSGLYIAGGFGSFLDCDSAARIGLFPEALKDRVTVLGNAALAGAAVLLLNRKGIAACDRLSRLFQTVQFSGNQIFYENFIDCMTFHAQDP